MKKIYLSILCTGFVCALTGCLGTYFTDDANKPEGTFESLHSVPDRPQGSHGQEEYHKIRASLEQDHALSARSLQSEIMGAREESPLK